MLGEKEINEYSRILEGNSINQTTTREKAKMEYHGKSRKLHGTKPRNKNLNKDISTSAFALVIFSGSFLK